MADPALEAIIDRPDPNAPAGDPAADDGKKADDAKTFDAKYVEELRRENAKYRTAAKAYDDIFGQYEPEDRQFLLDLARDVQTSPTTAVQRAQQLIAALGGNATAPDDLDDEARPLTKAEVAQMLTDFAKNEQTTRQQEAAINDVYAEAEKLGYKRDTPEMTELLWYAGANEREHGEDSIVVNVTAGHKAVEARRQAIVDAAFEAKRADAANTPRVVGRAGAAPGGDKPIKSLKDSKAALTEALKNGL